MGRRRNDSGLPLGRALARASKMVTYLTFALKCSLQLLRIADGWEDQWALQGS